MSFALACVLVFGAISAPDTASVTAPRMAAPSSAVALGSPIADAETFFQEFAKKREGIQFLEARFVQKHVTDRETVRAEGKVMFTKPRRILFRFESDNENATYLIDGRRAYEYEPDVRQVQIYDLEENEQTEVFFLGFDDNIAALRKGYDVSVIEPASASDKEYGSRALQIRPKPKATPQEKDDAKKNDRDGGGFETIVVFLRDKDYVPSRIHLLKEDDTTVDIQLFDIAVRDKPDPAAVTVKVPQGTKIVENDGAPEQVGPEGRTLPSATTDAAAAPTPPPVTVQELAPAPAPTPKATP